MRRTLVCVPLLALLLLLASACGKGYTLKDQRQEAVSKVFVDRSYFRDAEGRYVFFHGVNVSGTTKVPVTTDPVSYVGRPFPLEEADANFKRLRDAGFNFIRYLIIWDAIEHDGPGLYDEDYLDYLERIVAKANQWGIYVMLDMHQDMFSPYLRKWYNQDSLMQGFDGMQNPQIGPDQGPLNSMERGDGAPEWVVKTILFNKNLDSPEWGFPAYMVSDPANLCDVWGFNPWGGNLFASMDVTRCYGTFFGGKDVFPNWQVGGKSVQDFLQDAYRDAWVQVARRVGHYPNVVGYDLMNEPSGWYVLMPVYALANRKMAAKGGGPLTAAEVDEILDLSFADAVAGGMPLETVEIMKQFLRLSGGVPDTAEKLAQNGFPLFAAADDPHAPDVSAALGMNRSFDRKYLQPLFEKVGQAIVAEDPDAIIFVEQSMGLGDGGIGGFWAEPMLRPAGVPQVAYGPHYYADIYPYMGIDSPPRNFTVDEVKFDDYTSNLQALIDKSKDHFDDAPVLLGEYGTWFNFGGIEKSMAENYAVSSEFLDNYYEDLEALLMSSSVWCYSADNTALLGDGWNEEDFSVLGPDRQWRSWTAWMRPYARASAGKLLGMHFYSDHHYYDPTPGRPTPLHEFYLQIDAKVPDAPTEIFVPRRQYPDGFYAYLSDGRCVYDPETFILYWYVDDDDPTHTHDITLRPPYENYGDSSWDYFFNGDVVRENGGQ